MVQIKPGSIAAAEIALPKFMTMTACRTLPDTLQKLMKNFAQFERYLWGLRLIHSCCGTRELIETLLSTKLDNGIGAKHRHIDIFHMKVT